MEKEKKTVERHGKGETLAKDTTKGECQDGGDRKHLKSEGTWQLHKKQMSEVCEQVICRKEITDV